MNIKENSFIRFSGDHWIILSISSFYFFLLLLPSLFGYYGYHADEIVYIACSKRLAPGYIDHPPFSIFLLRIIRLFLGDSILAIRLLPALASAFSIFLVGIITKKLGGQEFAQGLACFASAIIPHYLLTNTFYSPSSFEPLLLTCCILILIIIIQDNKQWYWLLLGLMMGIGLINKHTFVIFGFAIFIGIIFTPLRKYFYNKFFWFGILITVIVILPNIIWQIHNNFISIEHYKSISIRDAESSAFMFILMQIITTNPVVFPIWLLGIIFLFFKTEGKPYRVFGWMFLTSFIFFLLTKTSRSDRVGTIYPILIASGSIMIEIWINRINKNWFKPVIISILIIGGIFSFSTFLPILPPNVLFKYSKIMGYNDQALVEEKKTIISSQYPAMYLQIFANKSGWESLVEDVASAYNGLADKDKKNAIILASNCWEAGAIEFFGPKYNLPMVISPHMSYWSWGHGNATGDLVISIGVSKEILDMLFEKVEDSGIIHTCDFCIYYEDKLPVYICRKIKIPVKEVWKRTNPVIPLWINQ
jgi:hypothetical protein